MELIHALLVLQIAQPVPVKALENVMVQPIVIQDFTSLLTTCAKLVLQTVLHALLQEVINAIPATKDTIWSLENVNHATALIDVSHANQLA